MKLSENVTVLKSKGKTYYILGTAHVSKKSADEAKKLIQDIKPDVVCVELCQLRYDALMRKKRWEKMNIFQVIKEKKMLFLLANLAISAFQQKIGKKLGVKPGQEFIAAINESKKVKAEIVLADRNIQATLKRSWANVSLWKKMKLISSIITSLFIDMDIEEEEIEKMKEKDQLAELMNEFAKENPEIKESLIDERDKFLMSSIEEAKGKKIIAVVGAGHVEGMQKYFGKKIDREKISQIPESSLFTKSLKWVIPSLVVLLFAYGFYKNQGQTFDDMLYAWILPNSLFCAVFTALAGARPISILAAIIASPITSLNPALPAGVIVGLTEAWLRKPTVEDCKNIPKDVKGIRGIYKNNFTRVLLVAVLANFGSALGAWIGLSWLFAII